MKYEHRERSEQILDDLVEYTGRERELVSERCKSARVELAWEWPKRKDVLEYYRTSDLYIFDLTLYQAMLIPDVNYMIEEIDLHGIKKVLDFGGGIGEYSIRTLQETKANVTYLELKGSKTAEYAQWRFKKHHVKPTVVSEDYPWQDEDWDCVFIMDVLEHLENPESVIENLQKRAKYLFVNPEKIMYNPIYPQHISHFELKGFEKVEINLYKNISKK